jgi:hypothetical protein
MSLTSPAYETSAHEERDEASTIGATPINSKEGYVAKAPLVATIPASFYGGEWPPLQRKAYSYT